VRQEKPGRRGRSALTENALQEAVFAFDHETSEMRVVAEEFPGEQPA
jgi:hypothetical protein